MTVKVSIDGIEAVVDMAVFGKMENSDFFVKANILPVAHIAANLFFENMPENPTIPELIARQNEKREGR